MRLGGNTQWAKPGESLLSSGDEGFNSALKDTSLKEDTVPTFKAFNPYISTEPDYLPLIAAAGVLLLEANHIAQPYLHNHSFLPKSCCLAMR